MESENTGHTYGDNRDAEQSRQSLRTTPGKRSQTSSFQSPKRSSSHRDKNRDADEKESSALDRSKTHEKESSALDRSKTRIWDPDPDRDRMSDEEERRRSSRSFYSDKYENESLSERSFSPYSRSRTPSPSPPRGGQAKKISNSPGYKKGAAVVRRGVPRLQRAGGGSHSQQHRLGVRSQSKDSTAPSKDLDLVTKRLLSARLLKINELRNAFAELGLRTEELQKENRILKQLQVRQEKALHRYDDTESEITQLLSRHNNETHALRERLRRAQERERAAERQLKASDERLQRSQAAGAKLKKLAEQRELGPREELSRQLEEQKTRTLEGERRIKELERSMELSSSSYQRQLATEKRKYVNAQNAIMDLQEDLGRLGNKLKEKERELDTRNIYANRMVKPTPRKDNDSDMKSTVSSRNSTKAVQTEADRMSSLDFPTPPPITPDANNEQAPNGYLSLKELDEADRKKSEMEERKALEREQQRRKDMEWDNGKERKREKDKKRPLDRELNALEAKARTLRDGRQKEEGGSALNRKDVENGKHGRKPLSSPHVAEEQPCNKEQPLPSPHAVAEEELCKKEQLLARMHEIDGQNQPLQHPVSTDTDSTLSDSGVGTSGTTVRSPPPRFTESRNQNPAIFRFTETTEESNLRVGAGSREGGDKRSVAIGGGAGTLGVGRRGTRTSQASNEDMAFGSYAPSFGRSAARSSSSGFPPPPPREDRDSTFEAMGFSGVRGIEKDRDSTFEAMGFSGVRGIEKDRDSTFEATGLSGVRGIEKDRDSAFEATGLSSVRGIEKDRDSGPGKDRKSNLMQQLFGALATPVTYDATSNKMEVLSSPPTTNGIRTRREGLLNFNSPAPTGTPPTPMLGALHVAESKPVVRAIASFDDDIEELTL